jgi:AraC-like DNA-binding protein
LLARGSVKIAEVAAESGYDSEAAFSRAFKKFVGVSPAEWRKQKTNEKTESPLVTKKNAGFDA